jgi:uncharacterized protein YlxP (DUF503 family)
MVVGVSVIDLRIPENHSLKGKRQVLRKLIDQIRNRFNVAIAEVDDHDLWQRAKIGICAVSNDRRVINAALDKVIDFVESVGTVEVIATDIEILTM